MRRTPDEEPPLKADPLDQLKLLDLQHIDSSLDQMAHQARTLPEHGALTRLAQRRTDLADRHGQLRTEVEDLERTQRKADADVEQVRSRRARNRERIDGGLVSDPKQLQAMQHEVRTLDRRISDLEDEDLEVMEQLEQAQSRLTALEAELVEIDSAVGDQTRSRDEAAVQIETRRSEALAERELLVADLPLDMLKLYDKLRAQLGGVAVGALHHGRCGGCQLDLGAADLARMTVAPSDEVLRCEECDRILVRTPESGI